MAKSISPSDPAQYDDSKHQIRYTSFDGQTIVQDYDTESRIKQQQLVDNKRSKHYCPDNLAVSV